MNFRMLSRLTMAAFAAGLITSCAATPQEVRERLGDRYIGKNADELVAEFGPPASTFKMNSGETAYTWQLSAITDIETEKGSGTAQTSFCRVNVIASQTGVVSKLTTEDASRGMLGLGGSICARRLGMQRSRS